jgi:hypothetical protein
VGTGVGIPASNAARSIGVPVRGLCGEPSHYVGEQSRSTPAYLIRFQRPADGKQLQSYPRIFEVSIRLTPPMQGFERLGTRNHGIAIRHAAGGENIQRVCGIE